MSRMKSTSRGRVAVMFFAFFSRQFVFLKRKVHGKINLQIDELLLQKVQGWEKMVLVAGGELKVKRIFTRQKWDESNWFLLFFQRVGIFSPDSCDLMHKPEQFLSFFHLRMIKTSRHRQQQRISLQSLISFAFCIEILKFLNDVTATKKFKGAVTARSCPFEDDNARQKRFSHKFSWVGGFQSFPTHRPFTSNSHLPLSVACTRSEASETIVDVSGYSC